MAYLYVLLAVVLWGSVPMMTKLALQGADAVLLVQIRFIISALVWLPGCLFARRFLNRRTALPLLGISMFGTLGMVLLMTIGLRYISAATASILFGIGPLLTVLLGHFFWKERAKSLDLLFCASILAGVIVVVGWPRDFRFFGCFLVMLAEAAFVCSIHWSKRVMKEMPSWAFTAWIILFGVVWLLPCTALLAPSWHVVNSVREWSFILYLALGPSCLAYLFWNRGIQGMATATAGFFFGLEQVVGIALAAVVLGEKLGARMLIGAVLVILPILASALNLGRPPESVVKD